MASDEPDEERAGYIGRPGRMATYAGAGRTAAGERATEHRYPP